MGYGGLVVLSDSHKSEFECSPDLFSRVLTRPSQITSSSKNITPKVGDAILTELTSRHSGMANKDRDRRFLI